MAENFTTMCIKFSTTQNTGGGADLQSQRWGGAGRRIRNLRPSMATGKFEASLGHVTPVSKIKTRGYIGGEHLSS